MIAYELLRRIIVLIRLVLVFALISIINGMIIRMIIKGSAILVYPILWLQQLCMRRRGFQNRGGFYQSLGHTGALSAYLDRNERSKADLFLAVMMGLLVYYLMYISSQSLWTSLTFGETYSGIINDQYFFYVNYTELLFLLFCRSRSSIKYVGKYITVLNIIYLYYVNMYIYPPVYEAQSVLAYSTLFFLTFFTSRYEYFAVNKWNQCGSYTPSESNPRCGYHHILIGPEYNYGWDMMSLFYPLRFEETFPIDSQEAR